MSTPQPPPIVVVSKGNGTITQRRQRANNNTSSSSWEITTTSTMRSPMRSQYDNEQQHNQHHHPQHVALHIDDHRNNDTNNNNNNSHYSSEMMVIDLYHSNNNSNNNSNGNSGNEYSNYDPEGQQQPSPLAVSYPESYQFSSPQQPSYPYSSPQPQFSSSSSQQQPTRTTIATTHRDGGESSVPNHRMTEEHVRRFNTQQQVQQAQNNHVPIWKRKMIFEEDFYRMEDYHTIFRNPHHVSDAQYTKYVQQQGCNSNNRTGFSSSSSTSNGNSMMNKSCCAYSCSMFSGIAVLFLLWIGLVLDTQPLYIPGALPMITVQSTTTTSSEQQQQQQQQTYSSTTNVSNNYKQQQQSQRKGSSSSSSNQQQQRSRPRIQFIIPGKKDERLLIAKTAYQAATLYLLTMMISRYIYDPIPFHTFYTTYIAPIFRQCGFHRNNHHHRNNNKNSGLYSDIPEHQSSSYNMIGHHHTASASSMEGFILGGSSASIGKNGTMMIDSLSTTLPFTTTQQHQRNTSFLSSLYTQNNTIWTRTTHTMKRYLASKGWYQPSRRRKHYEQKKTG